MKFNVFMAFVTLVFFTSCGETYTVEKENVFDNQTWNYQDSVIFDFDNLDTAKRYSLYLDIAHSTEYDYQNIYIKIHTVYPSGKRISDQVGIDLAAYDGKWKGKCSGEDCVVPIVLVEHVKLSELGKHQFVFEQYTRDEALPFVEGLTFKVKED